MAKPIYIVMGSTGEYSDRREWAVKAYFDQDKAVRHADEAAEIAHKLMKTDKKTVDAYIWASSLERSAMNPPNPLDPDMYMDYTGTDYYVIAVELADHI